MLVLCSDRHYRVKVLVINVSSWGDGITIGKQINFDTERRLFTETEGQIGANIFDSRKDVSTVTTQLKVD